MTDKYNQDGSINENWLAEEITNREAGVEEVNIAQVKEVLRVTLDILAEIGYVEVGGTTSDETAKVTALIEKHRKPE